MQVFATQQTYLIDQLHIFFAGHRRQIQQLGIMGNPFIQRLWHGLQNRYLVPDRQQVSQCGIVIRCLLGHAGNSRQHFGACATSQGRTDIYHIAALDSAQH